MFRSRNEWFAHELQNHRREWACPHCQIELFTTKDEFQSHLELAHHIILHGSQLEALVLQSEEPVDRVSPIACRLCDEWETNLLDPKKEPSRSFLNDGRHMEAYGTLRQFRRHLGRHMEQLALFALPLNEGEDMDDDSLGDDEEDDSNDGKDKSIEIADHGSDSKEDNVVRAGAPREIQIDLPAVLVESLGSGAEVIASYLTTLAEAGLEDPAHHAPPCPVLCRICERQIPPWWLEKHTELCLQEHKAEMEVQVAQENLLAHRHAIVKVLDALEAREARKSRPVSGDQQPALAPPQAEYKGMPMVPAPSPSTSSGAALPGTNPGRSRERPSSGFGHARSRSFAIRRPHTRIVELLLDLCDTAIEISTPAIKETSTQAPGEFRTQSPQSESRISQVIHWRAPSTNTFDQGQGLALLCSDSEGAAKAKVEAVLRHRRVIEYAEHIRMESSVLIQDCIDGAAKIAAGR
jgi:serine/threonine-protein kinase RIM15